MDLVKQVKQVKSLESVKRVKPLDLLKEKSLVKMGPGVGPFIHL